jgi:hypothetical protein
MRLRHGSSVFVPLGLVSAVVGYTWPNPPLDALERLRWDQTGFNSGILGALTKPCNQFIGGATAGNRTNAADWLRTVGLDPSRFVAY